jgi:CRISPR system Cascade subunit CasA
MVDVVRQCMAETDQAVRELGFFARNIKIAAGMDPELAGGIRESAKAEAYYELDVPFRMWLGGLGSNSSCQAERESWRQQAYRIVGFLAREMAEHVSTEAFTGRNMAVRNREEWLSFGTAEGRFWRGLRKALSIDEEVDNETK